jgi:homogentisate 1,2-dioxygenase
MNVQKPGLSDAGLYVRVRQRLRDGGAAGGAAHRAQLAAEVRLRALRRAAQRLAVHGAAGTNERSWLYRIRRRWRIRRLRQGRCIGLWRTAPCHEVDVPIAPMRWSPVPLPEQPVSFLQGVRTITTAGDAGAQAGMGAHVYLITRSMVDEYFYNADGELLFVPQSGALRLWTEFGIIDIEPGESRSFRAA